MTITTERRISLESRAARAVGRISDVLLELELAVEDATSVSECLALARHVATVVALAERVSRKALDQADTL